LEKKKFTQQGVVFDELSKAKRKQTNTLRLNAVRSINIDN